VGFISILSLTYLALSASRIFDMMSRVARRLCLLYDTLRGKMLDVSAMARYFHAMWSALVESMEMVINTRIFLIVIFVWWECCSALRIVERESSPLRPVLSGRQRVRLQRAHGSQRSQVAAF
jgi:hypothetical protein